MVITVAENAEKPGMSTEKAEKSQTKTAWIASFG
jgi:hypothetical protein